MHGGQGYFGDTRNLLFFIGFAMKASSKKLAFLERRVENPRVRGSIPRLATKD